MTTTLERLTVGVNVHVNDATMIHLEQHEDTTWLLIHNQYGSTVSVLASPANLERLCTEALAQLEAMKARSFT